jgi:hypothetical protein
MPFLFKLLSRVMLHSNPNSTLSEQGEIDDVDPDPTTSDPLEFEGLALEEITYHQPPNPTTRREQRVSAVSCSILQSDYGPWMNFRKQT